MLALYIIGGLVLLIVILLNCPVSVFLRYENKDFFARVRYLFLTLYPRPKKELKEENLPKEPEASGKLPTTEIPGEEPDTEELPDETLFLPDSEEPEGSGEIPLTREEKKKRKELLKKQKAIEKRNKKREKQRKKEDLKEKIALIKRLIASSGKGLKRIFKGIRFKDLYLRMDVADEDAAQCAIKYGKIGAAVYDGLSFLRTFFTVSVEKIELNCRYYTSEGDIAAHGTVTMRPATLLNALVGIGIKFLILTIKERKQKGKEDKK